ncbi:MAG: hypothetical protein PHQ13_14275 [Rhodoferax sp.]|nr:hypothetical protein [Rhodoferax sp.]MDD4944687.1 hypothetical protein [Rhodoferax sp.]
MSSFQILNKTSTKLALAAVFAASLAACGGSDSVAPAAPATVAAVSAPVAVAIDPTTSTAATAALVAAGSVTFPAGVTALGTTAATTLTFSAPAAGSTAVPFTMASGGITSKGALTFGSCIFTITEQPVGTVLSTPVSTTVPTAQCQLNVATTNAVADGSTKPRDLTFTIGTTSSTVKSVNVTVAADGTISVAGAVIGKGTVVQVTGAN